MKLNTHNWNTTDLEEIERRKLRAKTATFSIKNLEPHHTYFSSFIVESNNNNQYLVEIRSLTEHINSCNCFDYKSNELGTCKHIEYVIFQLRNRKKREFKKAITSGNYRNEVFFDTRDSTVRINWSCEDNPILRSHLDCFFSNDGTLLGNYIVTYPMLLLTINDKQLADNNLRVSSHINYVIEYQKHKSQIQSTKEIFLQDIEQGKKSLNILKHPLYQYQIDGMMHLAFTKRAMLADEMGLGKTVQAIAACELLRRDKRLQRVLIVATVSLKGEWEDQITKFTDLPYIIIQGSRKDRLKQYQQSSFFYITNYEQIVTDRAEIQRLIAPDIIILDEAQRIKNWQTKTATTIKQLSSEYAFVLTGTPLENRIDDIYSLVQFLDNHIFGSLFRFNRNFYKLDEYGKAIGYKHLDELHKKLHPIMLRRKKSDVEDQLPKRTIKNYFVSMEKEQLIRYNEYESIVARIVARAKRRPLLKDELERLQKSLACMRMICDTTYILDPDSKISPKISELNIILNDLLVDQDIKIVIFSEWERMLKLVEETLNKKNFSWVPHTGSIDQIKRRENIRKFKTDPNCRIFLSTDSGSVGLNLQNASVVINLDQPWNPAKLEQRIARVWRKHQMRLVQVINLISENSIEHNMLHVLNQKNILAQSVLDGTGSLKSMDMPSTRAAFVERIEELIGENKEQKSHTQLMIKNIDNISEQIDLVQTYQNPETGQNTVLVIADNKSNDLQKNIIQSLGHESDTIETLDNNTYATIQRLVDLGILKFNEGKTIHKSIKPSLIPKPLSKKQATNAKKEIELALRKQRVASLLIESGFYEESLPAFNESFTSTLYAFAWLTGIFEDHVENLSIDLIQTKLIEKQQLPFCALPLFVSLYDQSEKYPKTYQYMLKDLKVLYEYTHNRYNGLKQLSFSMPNNRSNIM